MNRWLAGRIPAVVFCSLIIPGWLWPSAASAAAKPPPAAHPPPAAKPPRLTEAQVDAIAQRFCKAVGLPVLDVRTRVFPSDQPYSWLGSDGCINAYFQHTWELHFGEKDDLEVHVADESGRITQCYRSYDHGTWSRPSDGPYLSRREAETRAWQVLVAAGVDRDVTAVSPQLNRTRPPEHVEWQMLWRRATEGVPYEEQYVDVHLDATSGAVGFMGARFLTPPVPPPSFKVTPERAVSLALSRMYRGLEPSFDAGQAMMEGVRPTIVPPNDCWKTIEDPPLGKALRGVWAVDLFSLGYHAEVWVDVETGQIQGGRLWYVPWVHRAVLSDCVKVAVEFEVQVCDDRLLWSESRGTASEKQNPDKFAILRDLKGGASVARLSIPRCRLVVRAADEDLARPIYYLADRGLIGLPGQWVAAPPELKAWLDGLVAAAAADKPASKGP